MLSSAGRDCIPGLAQIRLPLPPVGNEFILKLALGAAGVLATTLWAAPAPAQTVFACANARTGTVRLVSASEACRPNEVRVRWDLAGQPGPIGPVGATGAVGATGQKGLAGATGSAGATGETGARGPSGPSGSQGLKGDTGAAGATGPTGAVGVTGDQGPQGGAGAAGATGAAGAVGSIGPIGPIGETGAAGLPGFPGPAGPAGATGARGATGALGAAGATGSAGLVGPTGLTGPKGPAGPDGADGSPGPVGPTGVPGSPGTAVRGVRGQLVGCAGTTDFTGYLVYADGESYAVYTAADGRFQFDVMAPGTYSLVVEAGGRTVRTIAGIAVESGISDLGAVAAVDTAADPANCGACGNVCSSGVCAKGACQPLQCGAGQVACNFACRPADQICNEVTGPACAGVADCAEGEMCVDNECALLANFAGDGTTSALCFDDAQCASGHCDAQSGRPRFQAVCAGVGPCGFVAGGGACR
jgi:hypothetical protein